ncbi:MAG: FAD-dependent oxidoreductase [Acidimicrobiales bacterium]
MTSLDPALDPAPQPDRSSSPQPDLQSDSQKGFGDGGRGERVVIIGAGPAGLTSAFQLAKAGKISTVLEADEVVGGISRTPERDGWRFDIGGHRFFTKVAPVEALWHEILPDEDFLLRPRMSRIYYEGKYYDYPIKAFNALSNLGLIEAIRCVASYMWVKVRPPQKPESFEGWVAARYGWRLYRKFFKTYTEKVWGVDASELPADWAAQRIKNLTLFNAVLNALLPKRNQTEITSLIEEFQYPKYGPGMMWERCRDLVEAQGVKVLMKTRVTAIEHGNGRAQTVVAECDGAPVRFDAGEVVSSMPMGQMILAMEPPASPEVQAAARGLTYRDFLTIALVVPESAGFPDNWIYVHSPEVKIGRIQNFGSWSPYMVKDGRTCLGLEYFVFEGDELWSMADADLVELGKKELAILGLLDPTKVEAGYVVRMPKAYPHYDDKYRDHVEVLKVWLAENTPNVYPVGRNGMHRYNNQDHSMYTAMLSVENILGADHDIWAVNVEEEYHEQSSGTLRDSPAEMPDATPAGSATGAGSGRDAPIVPARAR